MLEEFGDEWGNKWMFHYRWAREIDQEVVSHSNAHTHPRPYVVTPPPSPALQCAREAMLFSHPRMNARDMAGFLEEGRRRVDTYDRTLLWDVCVSP